MKRFYKASFEISGIGKFEGFTRGEKWNGFGCPRFTKEEAIKIVQAINSQDFPSKYNEQTDEFEFTVDDWNDRDSVERYGSAGIRYKGNIVKVYPIGAWGWVWEEEVLDNVYSKK